mmetsp:Transcript_17405/g.35364  ORF Transcript_17405/g.35364 Transcript_17405/m.35364 type:complete len:204 (+) Transcript_17405:238-849(+)
MLQEPPLPPRPLPPLCFFCRVWGLSLLCLLSFSFIIKPRRCSDRCRSSERSRCRRREERIASSCCLIPSSHPCMLRASISLLRGGRLLISLSPRIPPPCVAARTLETGAWEDLPWNPKEAPETGRAWLCGGGAEEDRTPARDAATARRSSSTGLFWALSRIPPCLPPLSSIPLPKFPSARRRRSCTSKSRSAADEESAAAASL